MTDLYTYLDKNKALIEIENFEQCIEIFTQSGKLSSPFYYFRGHSNSDYRLSNTLDRFQNDEWRGKEKLLIRQFKKVARNYIQPQLLPTSTFEWLSLMQHYGVPTRLLDVTNSPYIALYFAVKDFDDPTDAAVWAINPSIFHEASLRKLQEANFPLPIEQVHGYHLPQFIQENYFTEAFMTGKYRVCMIIEPEVAEQRLFQQQGAFLVSSGIEADTEEILSEVLLDYIHSRPEKYGGGDDKGFWDWNLVKVIIPAQIKKKIFRQLLEMNINASTLFPDLSGAAKFVSEFVRTSEYIGNRWSI